ncbi:MAG: hypothetical protein O2971_07350 [Proteobacteria bacterium]|nr:hypothetical protein [Pseudomonadota bacterium]
MPAKDSKLLQGFARKAPEDFAHAVDSAPAGEVAEILGGLPVEARATVVAHLSPGCIDTLKMEHPLYISECIANGGLEDAKAILVRLARSSRLDLVNAMPANARRRALLRFMNYPDHSIGNFVTSEVIIVPQDSQTDTVLALIRKSRPGCPVLLQSSKGTYAGIMDARRVIEGNSHESIENFADEVKPLQAEMPILEAVNVDQWNTHTLLPVVDFENHILGVVDREDIVAHVSHHAPQVERARDALQSVLYLYLKVMSSMMQSLFSKGEST